MFIYTLGDILFVVFFAAIIVSVLIVNTIQWLHQSKCEHTRYYETQACDAICVNCRKNLGFIGNVRKKEKESKENV